MAIARPRFSLLWLLPVLLWVEPRAGLRGGARDVPARRSRWRSWSSSSLARPRPRAERRRRARGAGVSRRSAGERRPSVARERRRGSALARVDRRSSASLPVLVARAALRDADRRTTRSPSTSGSSTRRPRRSSTARARIRADGRPADGRGGPYPYPPLPALLAIPLTRAPARGRRRARHGRARRSSRSRPCCVLGVRDWRCYGLVLLWPPGDLGDPDRQRDALVRARRCARLALSRPAARPVGEHRRRRWRRSSSSGRSSSGSPRRGGYASAVAARALSASSSSLASWAAIGFAGLARLPATCCAGSRTIVGDDSYTVYIVGLDLGLPSPRGAGALARARRSALLGAGRARRPSWRRARGVRPRDRRGARADADRLAPLLRAARWSSSRSRSRGSASSGSSRSRWSSRPGAGTRRRSRRRGRSPSPRSRSRSRCARAAQRRRRRLVRRPCRASGARGMSERRQPRATSAERPELTVRRARPGARVGARGLGRDGCVWTVALFAIVRDALRRASGSAASTSGTWCRRSGARRDGHPLETTRRARRASRSIRLGGARRSVPRAARAALDRLALAARARVRADRRRSRSGALPVFWLARRHLGSERGGRAPRARLPRVPVDRDERGSPPSIRSPSRSRSSSSASGSSTPIGCCPFALCAVLAMTTGELMGLADRRARESGTRSRGGSVGRGAPSSLLGLRRGRSSPSTSSCPHFSGDAASSSASTTRSADRRRVSCETLFTDPRQRSLGALVEGHDVVYLVWLGLPLLFLFVAVARARARGACRSSLANALSDFRSMTDPRVPQRRGGDPVPDRRDRLRDRDESRAAARCSPRRPCSSCSATLALFVGAVDARRRARRRSVGRASLSDRTDRSARATPSRSFPSGAPVTASNTAGAHLSARRYIYSVPRARPARSGSSSIAAIRGSCGPDSPILTQHPKVVRAFAPARGRPRVDEGVRPRRCPRLSADASRPWRAGDDRELVVLVDHARSGLLEELGGVRAVRLVDDDDSVAVGEGLPVAPAPSCSRRAGRRTPCRKPRSARRTRCRPRSSGIFQSEPVREAVGHEDAVAAAEARRESRRRPDRPVVLEERVAPEEQRARRENSAPRAAPR